MNGLNVSTTVRTVVYFEMSNYYSAQRKRLNVVEGFLTQKAFAKVSEMLWEDIGYVIGKKNG